jgi:hypothetical protein
MQWWFYSNFIVHDGDHKHRRPSWASVLTSVVYFLEHRPFLFLQLSSKMNFNKGRQFIGCILHNGNVNQIMRHADSALHTTYVHVGSEFIPSPPPHLKVGTLVSCIPLHGLTVCVNRLDASVSAKTRKLTTDWGPLQSRWRLAGVFLDETISKSMGPPCDQCTNTDAHPYATQT